MGHLAGLGLTPEQIRADSDAGELLRMNAKRMEAGVTDDDEDSSADEEPSSDADEEPSSDADEEPSSADEESSEQEQEHAPTSDADVKRIALVEGLTRTAERLGKRPSAVATGWSVEFAGGAGSSKRYKYTNPAVSSDAFDGKRVARLAAERLIAAARQ